MELRKRYINLNMKNAKINLIKEDIITKFGTPHCILTDNGTHFTSSMMNELIKQMIILQWE